MGQNQRDNQSPVMGGTISTGSNAGTVDTGTLPAAAGDSAARKVQMKRDLRGMSFADGQSQLQFKEAGTPSADPGSMAQIAEAGFAGPKKAVPHKEKVETTLGADLSAVSAYTGPKAKAACEQLGAEAFTLGSKMAFRDEQPALSTILHESTHAIQQGAADGSTATSVASGSSDGDMEAEANAAESAAGKTGTVSVAGGATKRVAKKVQRKADPAPAAELPPAPEKKQEKSPDSYQELKKLVQSTRAQQIGSIRKLLDGITISDKDVEKILRICEPLDGPTIGAMMQALPAPMMKDFIDNLNSPHVGRWRREVLESCFAAGSNQFVDLDTDVFTDMSLVGMAPRQQLQAAYVLRNLPKKKIEKILDSDNGQAVRSIMTTPNGYSKADFARENESALKKEKKKAGIRDEDAKILKDAEVQKKAKGMTDILDDFIVTDAEATRILDWMVQYYPNESTIGALARHLETKGMLDRLVNELPDKTKWGKGNRSKTFLVVLKSRSPEKNIAMAESLLSYGIFDWAITDEEARLAYHLVKSMPPLMQDKFRKADNGLWFVRMEHEQAASVVKSGEYKGVETKTDVTTGEVEDAAEIYAKKLEEKASQEFFQSVVALCEQGFSNDNSLKLYTKLSTQKDKLLLGATVRRLDTLNYVEPMLSKLGHGVLFAEKNRAATMRILSSRDVAHQLVHARELLSLGLFDWAVTSEEAYLAFHMVKALPEADRKAFMEADGGKWWASIDAEMSQQMREGKGTHLYSGGENDKDINSLRTQLLDDAVWTEKESQKLMGLVRMGIAAGDGPWIFSESEKRQAYKAVPAVVSKFHLYHPEKQPKYDPEVIAGTNYGNEGPLSAFVAAGQGIDFIVASDNVETAHYLGGKGLSLPELQDITGGNVAGVRFTRHEEMGEEGKTAKDKKEGANFADAKWDLVNGVMDIHAPDLRIAAINTMVGQSKISTKEGSIKGLDVTCRYPTKANPKPVYVEVVAKSVELNDVLAVHTGSMQTANKLSLDALFLKIGRPGVTKEEIIKAHEQNRVPVPIFGGIISSLTNLVDVIMVADDTKAMKTGFTDPKSPLGIEVNLGALLIDGLSTSGGQTFRKITLENLKLAGGQTKTAFIRAKIESLGRAILKATEANNAEKVAELKAEQQSLKDQLPELDKKEAKLFELQDKYRKDPKTFTDDDQKELDSLQKELEGGGYVVDLDSASLQGVDGTVKADDVKLKGIHGEASSQGMGFSMLTDAKMLEQFVQSGPPTGKEGIKSMNADAKAKLELGDVEVTKLQVQQPIMALADLDKRIKVLKELIARDKASEAERAEQARLLVLRPKIARYEELQAIGLVQLNDDQKKEYQTLVSSLKAESLLSVDKLRLEGATVGSTIKSDLSGASLEVGAKKLDASGIRKGGLEVGSVAAEDVAVDAQFGGLGNLVDPELALTGAGVKAKSLTINNIKDADSGLEVKRIHGEQLGLGLQDANTDASATVKAGLVEVEGINLKGRVKALESEFARLSALDEKQLTADKKARLSEVKKALTQYHTLNDQVVAAQEKWEKSKGTGKETAAHQELVAAQKALDSWSEVAAKITVKNVDFVVSGLGAVSSPDYDPKKVLDKGIHIEGKGGDDGKTIVGSVDVEGAPIPGGKVGKTELRNLSGALDVSSSKIAFDNIGLESLRVSGLRYAGGGTSLSVVGSAGLSGLKISGDVTLKDVVNPETKETEKALDQANIRSFEIAELSGSGISFGMAEKGIQVDLPKGHLRGIWAKDIVVQMPQKPGGDVKFTGSAGVKMLNLPEVQARMGDALKVRGSLSASNLGFAQADDGKRTIDVGNLDAHGIVTAAGGTSFKVDVTGLKGKVVQKGDETLLSGIRLKDFSVSNLHYAGGGKALHVNKSASLKEVTLDARVKTKTTGDGPKKKTELESCVIERLIVQNIDVEDLQANIDAVKEDKTKGIEGSEAKEIRLPKASIVGLKVTDLDVMQQTGNIHVESADVTGLYAAVGEKGKESLQATATINSKGLDFTLLGPNHQVIDFGTTSIAGTMKSGGVDVGFDAKSLQGKAELTENGAVLTNVSLGSLTMPHASYASAGMSVRLPKGGVISDITLDRAEVSYETVPPTAKGAKPTRKLKSVVVKEFHIKQLTTGSVSYTGISTSKNADGDEVKTVMAIDFRNATIKDFFLHGLNMDLAAGKTVVDTEIKDVSLKGLNAHIIKMASNSRVDSTRILGDVFASDLSAKITATEMKKSGAPWTQLVGEAKIGSAGMTDFSVEKGNHKVLSGDKVEIGAETRFLDDGRTIVDVNSATAKGLKIPLGKANLSLAELKAKGAHVELDANMNPTWAIIPELTIGNGKSGLPALSYVDPAGVTVSVNKGTVKNVAVDWKEGKISNVKVGTVEVEGGSYDIDPKSLSGKKSGDQAKAADSAGTPAPDMDFLTGVNGSVTVQFYWWYRTPVFGKVPRLWGGEDRGLHKTESVTMTITKGKFDAKNFEDQFGTAVDWFAIDFEQKGNTIGLEIGSDTVWTKVDPATAREFDKHGNLPLKDFVELVKKYAEVVSNKPADTDPSLYLPMSNVSLNADLTVDPNTEIKFPGVGKVTVGKPASGKNTIKLTGSPGSALELNLATFALQGIDWKTANMALKTGKIDINELKAKYDMATGRISGSLKKGTINDISVTF
ncbi:MAG: DUF4157 domain-containing protein [Myxococcales bacterium]|nr:DUF4157 domain-containing protein [Myxococcales bacterium]